MKSVFDKNINSNYDKACEIVSQDFSHFELIEMLKNGNVLEKQIAVLKLDSILSNEEGKILINNLTGCDGKIREAVAWKISELLYENKTYKQFLCYPEIFADATIDINANICRKIIDSAQIMIANNKFKKIYINKILKFINEAFSELDKIIYKDKKYTINKQLFKLYWSLEALKLFVNDIDENTLFEIIERAIKEKEYTIREKIAQILNQVSNSNFHSTKSKLSKDKNYYVRAALNA